MQSPSLSSLSTVPRVRSPLATTQSPPGKCQRGSQSSRLRSFLNSFALLGALALVTWLCIHLYQGLGVSRHHIRKEARQDSLRIHSRYDSPLELTDDIEHDVCKTKEYDCSAGCISIVGNGAISRAQAAMSLQCGDIYRANFMNTAQNCARRTTHCFFRASANKFHGIHRSSETGHGRPISRKVVCPHTVFVNAGPEERNMTWSEGTYETSVSPRDRTLLRVWKHVNKKRVAEGRENRPRGPFGKQPSTGLHMMAYALSHRKNRCIHVFGFNFQRVLRNSTWTHTHGHPWALDKQLFAALEREDQGIFYHSPPFDVYHFDREPTFGLPANGMSEEEAANQKTSKRH